MPLDEVTTPSAQWAADLATASLALARRMAVGATLWSWSPLWPQHAEHVAVEFVHPVVMGTRAVPAEAVGGPDPVATLRAVAEPGDVLIVVGGAECGDPDGPGEPGAPSPPARSRASRVLDDLFLRARAWGLETIWIGAGPRPPGGGADHLVWVDEPPGSGAGAGAAYDGRLVLSYHVLWELTHICFEHPGLLEADAASCEADVVGHCVTCADEGRLGEVVSVAAGTTVAVRTASGVEEVDASLVDPLAPGDVVLVHAGVALSRVGDGRS